MHDLLHVRREFDEWFDRKKKARAFPNDDVELHAANCVYGFGLIALNHRRINEPWMGKAIEITRQRLDKLEAMLGRP